MVCSDTTAVLVEVNDVDARVGRHCLDLLLLLALLLVAAHLNRGRSECRTFHGFLRGHRAVSTRDAEAAESRYGLPQVLIVVKGCSHVRERLCLSVVPRHV